MNRTKKHQEQPSAFARIVDKLRNKPEAKLKALYLRLFKNDLKKNGKRSQKKPTLKKPLNRIL